MWQEVLEVLANKETSIIPSPRKNTRYKQDGSVRFQLHNKSLANQSLKKSLNKLDDQIQENNFDNPVEKYNISLLDPIKDPHKFIPKKRNTKSLESSFIHNESDLSSQVFTKPVMFDQTNKNNIVNKQKNSNMFNQLKKIKKSVDLLQGRGLNPPPKKKLIESFILKNSRKIYEDYNNDETLDKNELELVRKSRNIDKQNCSVDFQNSYIHNYNNIDHPFKKANTLSMSQDNLLNLSNDNVHHKDLGNKHLKNLGQSYVNSSSVIKRKIFKDLLASKRNKFSFPNKYKINLNKNNSQNQIKI